MNFRLGMTATVVAVGIGIGIGIVQASGPVSLRVERAAARAQSLSVWDGVYSTVQQKRGDGIYARECSTCHGETLKGGEGAPALTGPDFIATWNALTVGDLYEKVKETMPAPPEQPGSLTPQQNADVIAFILSVNAFPAGDKDLPSEAGPLQKIRITAKR